MSDPLTHSRIRVMLADDHAIVREGYRALLQKQQDLPQSGVVPTLTPRNYLVLEWDLPIAMIAVVPRFPLSGRSQCGHSVLCSRRHQLRRSKRPAFHLRGNSNEYRDGA